MGSEEAKENAEFGRGKRKGGPSTKQREAAEASELDQQQEAAERKKRKKAPAKSAVESAERSDGTVGSEFELHQPNSASSAKHKEAAAATALAQQKEAAERRKPEKAPAKSAVESAVESTELSDGTVGSEFELNQPNSASSAKQRVNEPPEQTAAKTGKDKKKHAKYCHFCGVWPTACAFPGEPALL